MEGNTGLGVDYWVETYFPMADYLNVNDPWDICVLENCEIVPYVIGDGACDLDATSGGAQYQNPFDAGTGGTIVAFSGNYGTHRLH